MLVYWILVSHVAIKDFFSQTYRVFLSLCSLPSHTECIFSKNNTCDVQTFILFIKVTPKKREKNNINDYFENSRDRKKKKWKRWKLQTKASTGNVYEWQKMKNWTADWTFKWQGKRTKRRKGKKGNNFDECSVNV